MQVLKDRIIKEGTAVGSDRINVDGFINHKIDPLLLDQIGQEFAERFKDIKVDKILTVEASGIAIACAAARYFDFCPVVFAKKAKPNTMTSDCYTADCMSFTKQQLNVLSVSVKHLCAGEKILVIDDFLAHGEAGHAMADIVKQAGAELAGFGIVISKDFQGGRAALENAGYRVEILAPVASMDDGVIVWAE
ncbi:MAG: xanthine phosphoribosyltransferase [Parasporobacterium sp.]|nr:xanthine phosphoribosyltransferase [Parasporobacterium sp.]